MPPTTLTPCTPHGGSWPGLISCRNQLIHIVGVPTIVWSALVWLTYLKPIGTLPTVPPEWKSTLSLTWGFALTSGYGLYYTSLDPVAGVRVSHAI